MAREYDSTGRKAEAAKTRKRILEAAKSLFEKKGFEMVTICEIAQNAGCSAPCVYAIFQSKRGILLVLMDEAFAPEQYDALVDRARTLDASPKSRLEALGRLARKLYDAEKDELSLLRGASILDVEFRELELERERRRYYRLLDITALIAKDEAFKENFTLAEARDILWAFTGRDLYRMLVIERAWTSDAYEKWLTGHLVQTLLK